MANCAKCWRPAVFAIVRTEYRKPVEVVKGGYRCGKHREPYAIDLRRER